MKTLKNILLSFITIVFTIYLCTYIAVPYFLNQKDYSQYLTQYIKEQTKLTLLTHNYKISITPTLDINLIADEIQVFYPNKQQFLDIKNAEVYFSAIYLLKKELKLNYIKADELQFSTKLLKNGKTTFQKYLEENLPKNTTNIKMSNIYPNLDIKNYIIKLKDETTGQRLKIKGKNLKSYQTLDYKNIQIETTGEVFNNNLKYIDFDTKILTTQSIIEQLQNTKIDLALEELQQQKFYANVKANLKINEKLNKVDYITGKLEIKDFSITLDNKKLPPSNLYIELNKNSAKISTKFYTNTNESSDIKGEIKLTKPYLLNLHCNCPHADIENLKQIAIPILKILKIKNNLKDFNAQGTISANFNIQTDLKTVKSQGKINIINCQIDHKKIPFKITNINTHIDFSNNNITIPQTNILINNQPLKIQGSVNNNAYGNLKISAENLTLIHIIKAIPIITMPKNIIIQSGTVSFETKINGNLNTPTINTNSTIKNFSVKENKNAIKLNIDTTTAQINNNSKKYNGNVSLKGIVCKANDIPNYNNTIKSDEINLTINEKEIIIKESKINAGNAKLTITGKIKDYLKKATSQIEIKGSIDTNIAKTFLKNQEYIYTKGYLPIKATINTAQEKAIIDIKLLANPNNYITPIKIKNLSNKTTLTHIKTEYFENKLTLNNITLYVTDNINSLVNEINLSKYPKLINITGKIKNINNNPKLENINITTLSPLLIEIPKTTGTSEITTILTLNGNIKSPEILGCIDITNINIPQYQTTASLIKVCFNKTNINTTIENLKIIDMLLSINSIAKNNFLTTNIIDYIKIDAQHINTDSLLKLLPLIPQAKYAPGNEFPFIIKNGKLLIKSILIDNIKAQNITADITSVKNIINLKNISSTAYGGKIAGNATYNCPYNEIQTKIQGRNLNASAVANDILPKEQQISGSLNFDADLNMRGNSFEQYLKTLKGNADVLIQNGHLGQLGRFEHFLYAQNLLSQRLIYANLNSAKQAISPKNTGNITYLKGKLKFNNGDTYLSPIYTAGDKMSMYIKGKSSLIDNYVNLTILGKISSDVSSDLGLLGTVTIKDFLETKTKYGQTIISLFNAYNSEIPEVDISQIPELSPDYKYQTKNFQVIITGDPNSVKSVKSFTWVNPIGAKQQTLQQVPSTSTTIPKTLTNIKETTPKTQTQPTNNKIQQPSFLDNIPDNFN